MGIKKLSKESKKVEKDNFCKLVQDESCHWYIIPAAKDKEWEDFRNIPEDDERSWDVPEFAKRIDGPHRLLFKEWVEE